MSYETEITSYVHYMLGGDDDWAEWAESGNAQVALARLGRMVLRNQHAQARQYVIEQITYAAAQHDETMEANA